jgi:hypothetical protein
MLSIKFKFLKGLICAGAGLVSIVIFTIGYFSCSENRVTSTDITSSNNSKIIINKIPELPWPIPKATSYCEINYNSLCLQNSIPKLKLNDINYVIKTALESAGFSELHYYEIPGGFALLTRIERFDHESGDSAPDNYRWTKEYLSPKLNILEIIKALSFERSGYFRVILFTITSETVQQSNKMFLDYNDFSDFIGDGVPTLPTEIGNRNFSTNIKCIAWIYEFEKRKGDANAVFRLESTFSALVHLCNAKILMYLSPNLCKRGV